MLRQYALVIPMTQAMRQLLALYSYRERLIRLSNALVIAFSDDRNLFTRFCLEGAEGPSSYRANMELYNQLVDILIAQCAQTLRHIPPEYDAPVVRELILTELDIRTVIEYEDYHELK